MEKSNGRALKLGTYKTILNGTYRYNKSKNLVKANNGQQQTHEQRESLLQKNKSEPALNTSKNMPYGYPMMKRTNMAGTEQGSKSRMNGPAPLFIKRADFLNQREDLGEEELDALVRDIEKMESSMNKKDHYMHSYTSAPLEKENPRQKSLISSKVTLNPNNIEFLGQNATMKRLSDKNCKKAIIHGSKKKLDNLIDLTREDFEKIYEQYQKKLEKKIEHKMNELERNSIKLQLMGLINPETQNLRINLHNA